MTTQRTIGQRLMSLALCLAVLLTVCPLSFLTAAAAENDHIDRVTDPSTMDDWKSVFPISGTLSTENAGRVWMDKSTFTDASAFNGTGITADRTDSILVALSAIASNMSITGLSHVPTDTMFVLDVSGSMNDNNGNNDVAQELVEAANQSIATLLSTNKYNRVGVVLYSGSSSSNTNNDAAIVLLPLGRYETAADGQYLRYILDSDRFSSTEYVAIDPDVVYAGTQNKPAAAEKEVVGATYIQKGIILAQQQFTAADNDVTINDALTGATQRKPVLVLMSDGAPTLASTNFTNPGQYDLGNGSSSSAAQGFVTQLSAAYAKNQIEAKYGTDCLFYSLGLGVSNNYIALSVLDPDHANASTAVNDFWTLYNAAAVGSSITVQSGNRGQADRTVTKLNAALEQNYVDQYFNVDSGNSSESLQDKLIKVFQDIVGTIQLQSTYFPTLISGSEELSGYVSFVDRLGEYVEVVDVKGILIHNQLFSGSYMASNFVSGGGALGTFDNPSALGHELVASVKARLGLESDDVARTLISLAYNHGQLSYTDENNYSNYIGWYANAKGEFLGFYHEGVTVLPEATGNADTDPAFTIKSYGYLGETDPSHGVSESDMMYATVQVRTNIATGEELVTFAVPAALIPVVTYNVTLDEDGSLTDLSVSGAQHPIRLVYEVALQDDINPFNVQNMVSAEYLADPHNVNPDGSINFYTSQWDHHNATGYGTINAYSYFNPSRKNDRYYYLEDTPIYSDTNGTLYTGSQQPSGDMYRAYTVYKKNGTLRTETVYRKLSEESMATALRNSDGTWYVPAGNVHVNISGFVYNKEQNLSGTLSQSQMPFVDTTNHSVNEAGYQFYVGATFGNNSKLTVTPETGIRLSKTMADGVAAPTEGFTFVLTNLSNTSDNTSYPAWLVRADGTGISTNVRFINGAANVQLKAGEMIYIGGMTVGSQIKIVEQDVAAYIVQSTTGLFGGAVTIENHILKDVTFVNTERGTGNLTIGKEVEHDFGTDYRLPTDQAFTMQVTLSGIGTANATFRASHTNGRYTEITTDSNGSFTVVLSHDQQFEVFGLPSGTVATVIEQTPGTGFAAHYLDNGVNGDGIVTVTKDTTVSVIVINDYTPGAVSSTGITVSGDKTLTGRDWQNSDSFSFQLQKLLSDGSWQQLGDVAQATAGSTAFDFLNAFANEKYTEPGTYYYRVVEMEPAVALGGITYDKTVHAFSVIVEDADMDGYLEVSNVVAARPDTTEIIRNGNTWQIHAHFVNTYKASGSTTVTIDLNKLIANNGGSNQSLAGYTFGLYQDGQLVHTSPITTDRGFARMVLSYEAVGTHHYILKEIVPATIPAGWSYSTLEIPVTVVITDTNNGNFSSVIYTGNEQPSNAGTSISVSFTNTYDPADAVLPVDFVTKQLIGRDLNANEFTFEVRETDGTTVLIGSNAKDGKVTFNGSLKFEAVGVYYFNIVETGNDANGVTLDKTVYQIRVVVTDENGQLSATYSLINAVGNQVVFQNVYTPASVTNRIEGDKELIGRALLNDEFTFILTEVSINGMPVAAPVSYTAKNFADSSILFPAITYTKAGVYTYHVSEQQPTGTEIYGISYDTTVFEVTVTVIDNKTGNLEIAGTTVKEVGGTGTSLVFENIYTPNKTSVQISGDKELIGKVDNTLSGGEYSFKLYGSNASWSFDASAEALETVQNGSDGLIRFTAVDFDTAGHYYYIIVEENHGQVIDGVTYDSTIYRVFIDITDDLKGQLHATVHIYDSNGVPQEEVLFVNEYTITGDTVVNLSGNKYLDGREFSDDDSFRFNLYQADDQWVPGSVPVFQATANAANGFTITFNLPFTAEDVGKTFYYVLVEENAGLTLDRITYSSQSYLVAVTIRDNNVGGIEAVVVITDSQGNPVDADALNFRNVYTPKPADLPVRIHINKTVVNKGASVIGPEGFNFLLTDLDSIIEAQHVTSDAEGKAAFSLIFSEDDIGKTFRYQVTEVNDGIENVKYSESVYTISITISLNDQNELVAAITVDGEAVTEAVAAFENEYDYTPPVPDNPKTGDSTIPAMWIALLLTSGGAAITLFHRNKKNGQDEEI